MCNKSWLELADFRHEQLRSLSACPWGQNCNMIHTISSCYQWVKKKNDRSHTSFKERQKYSFKENKQVSPSAHAMIWLGKISKPGAVLNIKTSIIKTCTEVSDVENHHLVRIILQSKGIVDV